MQTLLTSLLCLLALSVGRARAQEKPPPLTPCTVRGLSGEVLCGSVRVPEDPAKPAGRQIDIAVVIARAIGPGREPDPFVLLAGGPGQAGTEMGPFASEAFGAVRQQRDLVLLDARGTGRSNPLRCALLRRPEDFAAWTLYPPESVRRCRDSLAVIADLRQYTTANIADDLEAVRKAFGWPQLNLYGTSYGTRLALVFLRRHESSVRSVVLKAVAPPSLIAPMNYAQDAERAFGLLERDCRADPACFGAFPSLRADLDSVLARAGRGALRAAVPRGTGGTDTVPMHRDAIAGTLMGALQSARNRIQIPAALRAAAAGNPAPLLAMVLQYRSGIDAGLYIGMHLSVSCAEDARRLELPKAREDDGRTFLGSSRVRMLAEACADWPVGAPSREAFDPVRSRVPVLLVSGELDPNTPPRHAEAALRTLTNGRHVLLRGVAHGWTNVAACGSAFVAQFVTAASARGLDVACGETSSAPAFPSAQARP